MRGSQRDNSMTSGGWVTSEAWNRGASRRRWLLAALAVGVVGQLLFLNCLCHLSRPKLATAGWFDLLWATRLAWTEWRGLLPIASRQGWLFYAGLMVSSPAWIHVIWEVMLPALR